MDVKATISSGIFCKMGLRPMSRLKSRQKLLKVQIDLAEPLSRLVLCDLCILLNFASILEA